MQPYLRLEISSYALCILLGMIAGLYVAMRRSRTYGIGTRAGTVGYLFAVIGAMIGGKTFFVIQGLPQFLEGGDVTLESFLFYVGDAGQVFYGGMIGALSFVYFAARIEKMSYYAMLDPLLPALPLAQAFGRVGCFMAGCCYGLPGDIGFSLPGAHADPGVRVFPIQLMESACVFCIFVLLIELSRKKVPCGTLLGTYLAAYGTARFVLEFFRGDAVRGFIGPLSVAQWISLGCIAVGVVLLTHVRRTESRREASDTAAAQA